MKYIDAEKLIAEIERRLNVVEPHKDTFESAAACRQELIWMKDFITSLPKEQPSDDLEKELRTYLFSREYLESKESGCLLIARHFAQWQKEQMMKDAYVESRIVEDGRIELEGNPLPCLNPIILLPYPQFKPDNKVKIIIVKEKEK